MTKNFGYHRKLRSWSNAALSLHLDDAVPGGKNGEPVKIRQVVKRFPEPRRSRIMQKRA